MGCTSVWPAEWFKKMDKSGDGDLSCPELLGTSLRIQGPN